MTRDIREHTTNLTAFFTQRDAIIYALGIGCCSDNQNWRSIHTVDNRLCGDMELKYVYENHPHFEVFPTFWLSLVFQADIVSKLPQSNTLNSISRIGVGIRPFPPQSFGDGSGNGLIPSIFFKDPNDINGARDLPVLHVTQKLEIHKQLPACIPSTQQVDLPTQVFLETRILSVDPRNIGTFVVSETKFYFTGENDEKYWIATAQMKTLVLGVDPKKIVSWKSSRHSDPIIGIDSSKNTVEMKQTTTHDDTKQTAYTFQIPRNAALIYRLSGDYNPLHVCPNKEWTSPTNNESLTSNKKQENNGAILHGLCTLGYTARAVLEYVTKNKCYNSFPPRLLEIKCDFLKPVFVGDSLKIVVSDSTNSLADDSENSLRICFTVYRASDKSSHCIEQLDDVEFPSDIVLIGGAVLCLQAGSCEEIPRIENTQCRL